MFLCHSVPKKSTRKKRHAPITIFVLFFQIGSKRQQDILAVQHRDGTEITDDISKDFSECFSCILSFLYGDTISNVLNAIMTRKVYFSSLISSWILD